MKNLTVFKSGEYYKHLKTGNIVLCLNCDYCKHPIQFTGIFLMNNTSILQKWGISDYFMINWQKWNP
jgi:hypothetical protein